MPIQPRRTRHRTCSNISSTRGPGTKHFLLAHPLQGSPRRIPQSNYNDPGVNIPGANIWFSIYENSYTQIEESLRLTGKMTFKITPWFNAVLDGYVNNYYIKSETKELGNGYRNAGGYYSLGHTRKQQRREPWLNFFKNFDNGLDVTFSTVNTGESGELHQCLDQWRADCSRPVFAVRLSKRTGQSASISNTCILQSLMFFSHISWKDQLLSITGRNDWSSTLTYANGSGNSSYFYPSVSLSWLFTETFEMPEWFDYGKVRASWAHVGNDSCALCHQPRIQPHGNRPELQRRPATLQLQERADAQPQHPSRRQKINRGGLRDQVLQEPSGP